jgi:hypothetical protein
MKLAHRVSYEAAYGPIPAGLHIDHLCRVRKCVRPEHLEAVTQGENNLRAFRRITPEMAQQIIDDPGRQVDIAKRFGTSQTNVSRIKRGALVWQRHQNDVS